MSWLERALATALRDPGTFSRYVLRRPLRPYQLEPARAIVDSVLHRRGLTFTVMMSRQAGKNELSAQLECYLLNLFQRAGGNLVKAAPTFKPQVVNSKLRLEQMLKNPWNRGRWRPEMGYMLRLGEARVLFFSAEPGANVVGATAHLGLEFDEAQDIAPEKHSKDFLPMGAATNCTRVYYGTAWDSKSLLEQMKQLNLEAERRDGIRRHFEYPWWVVAEHNWAYRRYVEAERARLGDDHPLFKTQYRLTTLGAGGGFLSASQRAQMAGQHSRLASPEPGKAYVAGVDIAGEDEMGHRRQDTAADAELRAARPRRDSTVVTIAEVDWSPVAEGLLEPRLLVREHLWWTGRKHREQYAGLLDLLRNVWGCGRVVVDATGVGAGVASFLAAALGETVVEQFVFTAPSKSALAYALLGAVNAGRLKLYAPDGSPECQECWRELELARCEVRAHQQMSFHVDESEGHDDFLMSLALCVRAAEGLKLAPGAAVVEGERMWEDGAF